MSFERSSQDGAAGGPNPKGSSEAVLKDLTPEKHAVVAAHVAVRKDQPRAEVLAPFGISEAEWEILSAKFNRRMVEEIRDRAGSEAPVEERFPLSAAFAKAYALAVRDVRREAQHGEDEATIRIAPNTPMDEPFSVLGASNRAASQRKS